MLSVFGERAKGEAEIHADGLAKREGQRLMRVAATPVLADPTTWRCLAEADRSTFRFDMKLGTTSFEDLRNRVAYAKPSGAEAEAVARASEGYAARVFLDFARFPVARVVPGEAGASVVQFADLRYTEPGSRSRAGGFALDVPVGAAQPAR